MSDFTPSLPLLHCLMGACPFQTETGNWDMYKCRRLKIVYLPINKSKLLLKLKL